MITDIENLMFLVNPAICKVCYRIPSPFLTKKNEVAKGGYMGLWRLNQGAEGHLPSSIVLS